MHAASRLALWLSAAAALSALACGGGADAGADGAGGTTSAAGSAGTGGAASAGAAGTGGKAVAGASGVGGVGGSAGAGTSGVGGSAGAGGKAGAGTSGVGGISGSAGAGAGGGAGATGGTAGGAGGPTLIPGPTVRVVTFNVRTGNANDGDDAWGKRKGALATVWKELAGDLYGIQEAIPSQLADISGALPAYARFGQGRLGGQAGEHSDIYYKTARFTVVESGTFWLSPTPEKPGSKGWDGAFERVCTWGRFEEKATGYRFYHFNTHLDHKGPTARQQGMKLIAARIAARAGKGEPVFLTGDFNSDEDGVPEQFLRGDAAIDGVKISEPMRDSFRVLFPGAKGVRTAHGFNGGTDGAKIDYVFIGKGITPTGAGIDHSKPNGRFPSDHYPVWTTAKLPDQQKP